ncbi:MAG: PAS domain-containing protein [Eubacterium sp.]|nr:PAS domain-containing protein [Eubacterium sp.]
MNNMKDEWTNISAILELASQLSIDKSGGLPQIILSVIQDGVCFISEDLRVLYSNIALKAWYGYSEENVVSKCYELYHFRDTPCENCPVLKAMKSKQPETAIQTFESKDGKREWHRLFAVPLINENGKVISVIEYVRNITAEKKSVMEKELVKMQNQVLQELFDEHQEEVQKKEQKLAQNVNRVIESTLDYLKGILDSSSYDIVSTQLSMLLTGIPCQEEEILSSLSEKERMVARLVRDGYLSKEIAEQLCISKKAVDYHRTNLRKKLGLENEDNLQNYLKTHLKML